MIPVFLYDNVIFTIVRLGPKNDLERMENTNILHQKKTLKYYFLKTNLSSIVSFISYISLRVYIVYIAECISEYTFYYPFNNKVLTSFGDTFPTYTIRKNVDIH